MEKIRFPRGYKVYLPLVLMFALLVSMMPRSPKFNYDYKKGSPWMYEDLVSLFDFPLLKSEEQYKAELQKAGSAVVPVYRQEPTVADKAIEQLAAADLAGYSSIKPDVGAALKTIYSKGVLPKNNSQKAVDGLIYIQKAMRAGKIPAAEVYTVDAAAS